MNLTGKTIAILATDGVERVELVAPRAAFQDAGATCVVISEARGEIRSFDHLDAAGPIGVDADLSQTDAGSFDGLLLPGGVANPDALRQNPAAVAFIRDFVDAGKPIAAICHAPWLLIEANAVSGRSLTSWPSLKTDIENAGGRWSDQAVVADGQLVTSRGPDDLSVFAHAAIELYAAGGMTDAEHELDSQLDESFPASDPPSLTGGPSSSP